MKRINIKLIIALAISLIAFGTVLTNISFAAISISAPDTVEKGKSFPVTINLPSEAVGYNVDIKLVFNDGVTQSQYFKDAKTTGADGGDFAFPGNPSTTFTATASGGATIEANITISDRNENRTKETLNKDINITNPEPTPQPQVKLTGISVDTVPKKVNYKEGESFDKTGMVINATYSDGSNKNVTGYTYSPSGALGPNDTTITISYSEGGEKKTATQKITVQAAPQQNTSTNTTNTTNTSNTANNKVNNTNTNTNTNTTVVNPTFRDVNEKVYAIKNCNVRSSCSTSANNKIGSLSEGELVIRTGVSQEWSRIKYNGQVAYVASNLLTTEEPEENTEEVNNVVNELDNNTVSNELADLKSEIGVLPEVGNPVAVKIFFVISAISVACVSGLLYFKKNG